MIKTNVVGGEDENERYKPTQNEGKEDKSRKSIKNIKTSFGDH